MTKQQTVELLQKQLPGFYSVDQVIELINKIDESSSASSIPSLTEEQYEELLRKLGEAVEYKINRLDTDDIVDIDSAEFGLNGNEIHLEDISVNVDEIAEQAANGCDEVLTKFFVIVKDEGDESIS